MSAQVVTYAYVIVDGWAVRYAVPVEIIGETPTRYRCRLIERSKLPGRSNWRDAGHVFLAPKRAVRIDQEAKP